MSLRLTPPAVAWQATEVTAYDRFRDALEHAGHRVDVKGPRKFEAQCPVHDDRKPSLSVQGIEGQVLVYCHAGCDTVTDVMPALGLGAADLYDTRRGADYRYDDGRVVHRKLDKSFPQSGKTKGDGCLYRLAEVRVAVAAGRPVFVVEGEKDVHALEAVGAVATCSPMGAGKAHRCDWTPLRGATVRVVADRDDAGRKHARDVHGILGGLAATVDVFEAKAGKDAADHIAAGHGLEDFEPVAPEASGSAPVLLRLSDVTPERVEWLWPGRFPVGKLVILDGDPSLGKSTLALTFAAHLSTGKPWPDGTPCPLGDAVIMSAEDGLADTIRPRLDAAEGDPKRVHALTAVPCVTEDGEVRHRPPTLADSPAIRDVIERTEARLLVVDVLMAYLPTTVDSHRDQHVRGALHQLAAIAEQTGCTVLLLRHLNKNGGGNALYRGGGSIGIVGAARAGFLVAPDPEDDTQRVLACLKSNLAAEPPSLAYRLEPAPGSHVARAVWCGESKHPAAVLLATATPEERNERDEAVAWMDGYLIDNGMCVPARDILAAGKREGFSRSAVYRAADRLGVTKSKRGMRGGWSWRHPEDRAEPREDPTEGPQGPSSHDLAPSESSGDLRARGGAS